jgi:hypothetical protein
MSMPAVSPEASVGAGRSGADAAVRRLLGVPDGPPAIREDAVHRMFNTSMALSGLRCLLSYIVFPFLLPWLGIAAGVGSVIGIPIALVALTFDVIGMRRFWLANHRWRWVMTGIYAAVMVMVFSLLVADIVHLAR